MEHGFNLSVSYARFKSILEFHLSLCEPDPSIWHEPKIREKYIFRKNDEHPLYLGNFCCLQEDHTEGLG